MIEENEKKKVDDKYKSGYIAVSVIVFIILIAFYITIGVMFKMEIGLFAPYKPAPEPGYGLVQPNLQYYNTTLTPEQQANKDLMIQRAYDELNA